jgi:uncharacterized membrane protein
MHDISYNVIGIVSCLVLVVLDIIWLKITKQWYFKNIKNIQKSEVIIRMGPTIIVYVLMCMAVLFILLPLIYYATAIPKMLTACIIGLCIYGIYNSINYAVFSNYSWQVAVVDTIWGTCLFGFIGFLILKNS